MLTLVDCPKCSGRMDPSTGHGCCSVCYTQTLEFKLKHSESNKRHYQARTTKCQCGRRVQARTGSDKCWKCRRKSGEHSKTSAKSKKPPIAHKERGDAEIKRCTGCLKLFEAKRSPLCPKCLERKFNA